MPDTKRTDTSQKDEQKTSSPSRKRRAIKALILEIQRLANASMRLIKAAPQANMNHLERILSHIREYPHYFTAYRRACELLHESKNHHKAHRLPESGMKIRYDKKLKTINQVRENKLSAKCEFLKSVEHFSLEGQPKKAGTAIQEALANNPEDLATLHIALKIYRKLNKQKRATKIDNKLKEKYGTDPKNHIQELKLLMQHGSLSVAQDHADWLLSKTKDDQNFIFQNNGKGKQLYLNSTNLIQSKHDKLYHFWSQSFQTTSNIETELPTFTHQPFQYWSQGHPPKQILKLTKRWDHALNGIGLKKIIVFDRSSALEWITKNTPEFEESFTTAFHYAVEADVFRIAYALKNDCIWIDSDMVPNPFTAATLALRLLHSDTTLTMKAKNPQLTNCFFATKKSSSFFLEIGAKMKNYSFRGKKPSKQLVIETFGPIRYTTTLKALLEKNKVSTAKLAKADHSTMEAAYQPINFLNKETFAQAKSKTELDYFKTEDNWVNFINNIQ